jgi:hypothetical protein
VIPHNIDPKRFQNLLVYGIDGDSLMQFFRENKAALLGAAVKVDNLPPNPSAARKIVVAFGAKAHRVFGKWITSNLGSSDPVKPDELITRFRSVELGESELDDEERIAFAESGLRELYADPPPAQWLEFLCTPIGGQPDQPATVSSAEWIALAAWWLGNGPRPPDTNGIVSAVISLREAADRHDPAMLMDVAAFDGATEDLRALIQKSAPVDEAQVVQRGITAAGPIERSYDPNIDYTRLAVIATNRSPKLTEPFFVVAEAFIDDAGEVFSLSPNEMRHAIPSDARIVLHKDRGFPTAPTIGESFVYGVEKYKTDMPVKVKAVESIPDRLFRVVHIPVTSKEAHKIRDLIVEYARAPGARAAVFVTLDKACLRPRSDSIQRVLASDFDWHLDKWDSLKGLELANGAYVVAPFPPTTKGLDCSPLSVGAKRLLKVFHQRSEIKLPKAQRDLLQELISSDESDFEESTRQRLLTNLDAIDSGSEDFELLVRELVQSDSIKADVEKRVTEKVEALAAVRAKELQSIESLRREKDSIERRIARLGDEADKKAKAVRAAIQKAFASTSAKELETLGQIAVFEALIARGTETTPGPDRQEESKSRQVVPRAPAIHPSERSVEEVLRELGVKSDVAKRVDAALRLALNLGLPILVTGAGAFYLGTQLASSLCSQSCVVADVPIGLLEPLGLAGALSASDVDAILIRNANFSDLGVYACDLLSLVFQRAFDKRAVSKSVAIIITAATGPAALPVPDEISQMAVKIDLGTMESRLAGGDTAVSQEFGRGPFERRLATKLDELEASDPIVSASAADLHRLMNPDSVNTSVQLQRL